MSDIFLMELYKEYSEDNINGLIEFAKNTFPNDGTDNLFIGSVLMVFYIAGFYNPTYYCTIENLMARVFLAKEKIDDRNFLDLHMERVSEDSYVSQYLRDVVKNEELDKYADLIIEYLNQFRVDSKSQKVLKKF